MGQVRFPKAAIPRRSANSMLDLQAWDFDRPHGCLRRGKDVREHVSKDFLSGRADLRLLSRTLLDVLASRVTMGVITGSIFVDGEIRDKVSRSGDLYWCVT